MYTYWKFILKENLQEKAVDSSFQKSVARNQNFNKTDSFLALFA